MTEYKHKFPKFFFDLAADPASNQDYQRALQLHPQLAIINK